ncbi:hypothetical protein FALCPG4_015974 [Fusarium falciforme]
MRVAIIGAGPSGLVQLKTLATAHEYFPSAEPFELRLFETYDKVGGVFLHHVYEDTELVSSKFLTTFSDFRPRPEDNDFLSAERYREYLEDYTTHFNLWPYIHLGTSVTGISRGDVSEHVVSYRAPDGKEVEWECDAIAVCSGVHPKAHIPRPAYLDMMYRYQLCYLDISILIYIDIDITLCLLKWISRLIST